MKQGKNRSYRCCKLRALVVRGEENGGSEIVQTVIVLGFAVGLNNFKHGVPAPFPIVPEIR